LIRHIAVTRRCIMLLATCCIDTTHCCNTSLQHVAASCCCTWCIDTTHCCNTSQQHVAATCMHALQHVAATHWCNTLLQIFAAWRAYLECACNGSVICKTWLIHTCDMGLFWQRTPHVRPSTQHNHFWLSHVTSWILAILHITYIESCAHVNTLQSFMTYSNEFLNTGHIT